MQQNKLSLFQEISTLKEKKRQFESGFEALQSSADKSDGMRRTAGEKEQQLKSLEQEEAAIS